MGYDRGDSFPFDFEPNGNRFGSKSKGKLSPRSHPIQFGRKWNISFLSVRLIVVGFPRGTQEPLERIITNGERLLATVLTIVIISRVQMFVLCAYFIYSNHSLKAFQLQLYCKDQEIRKIIKSCMLHHILALFFIWFIPTFF